MSQNFLEIDKPDLQGNDKLEFENKTNMMDHDLLSQRSAPVANLASDSESEADKESQFSGELSKNQPQNAPNS